MFRGVIWLCYILAWVTALQLADDANLDLDLAENATSLDDGSLPNDLKVRALGKCNGPRFLDGDDPCAGREQEPGFVECDKPCKYTQDWFVKNKIWTPNMNECLFYTGGMSGNARRYSKNWNDNRGGARIVTIWQMWAKGQYNGDQTIDNPMRCIIQDDVMAGRRNTKRQGYFEAMSNAMAYICGGTSIVMESNMARGGSGYIKRAGIWGRVEFPRLQMDGDGAWTDGSGTNRVCNRIDAIGPDQADRPGQRYWVNWWKRGGPGVWPDNPTPPSKRDTELVKRDDPPLNSDVDDAPFDDPNGAWYVDW